MSHINNNIKNHVSVLCSNIYAATYMGVLNKLLVYTTLNEANRYGLLPELRKHYLEAEQYTQNVDELLIKLFDDDKDHVSYLLNSSNKYESQYLTTVGTGDTQHTHIKCYDHAFNLYCCVVKSPDFKKAYQIIQSASSDCVIQQTIDAFDAYFGDSERISTKNNQSVTAWITSSFPGGGESTTLTSLVNAGENTVVCSEQSIISSTTTQITGASDDKTASKSAKSTFLGGSARLTTNSSGEQFEKNNSPYYQSLSTAATMYTTLMMSNVNDVVFSDTISHTRINNTLKQLETDCDAIEKIALLFTVGVRSLDHVFTEQDSIKLYNRFLLTQIGNRGIVTDNNNKAITRDKPTDETATN